MTDKFEVEFVNFIWHECDVISHNNNHILNCFKKYFLFLPIYSPLLLDLNNDQPHRKFCQYFCDRQTPLRLPLLGF
uniref:Uncharacterized protein n=1 Tax=mine drainage metagenome TaxID=410659 RepID=E6QQP1_9ZZZZ